MSSVRIQAGKGGVALPDHGATKRGEAAGDANSFASALGVAAGPDGRTAANTPPAGADDAVLTAGGSGGTGAADAAPALVADGVTSGAVAGTDGAHQPTGIIAGGSGGTPATAAGTKLPALAAWFAPTRGGAAAPAGGSSTSGSRPHAPAGNAAPDPGVVGAAIVIAAPSAAPSAAPAAAPAATASPSSPAASGAAPHGVLTTEAGALPMRAGSGQAAAPSAITATATATATADAGQPVAAGTAASLSDPVASADPSIGAAPLAGSILTQAASGPTEAGRLDAAAAAPTPTIQIATLADAGAAATGGYDDRGSTSTGGRDREAARFAIGGSAATAAPAGSAVVPGATASGPAAVDPGQAGIADRLSDHIVRLLTNSGREAVVRLHPPELGEVMVRVAVNGRDVSAWFGSPQPLVQQAISQAIGQLHTDLGNAGYSLNGAWVGADASGSGGRGGAVPLPLPSAPVAVSEIAPQGFAAARPAASGVSIYV